MVVVVSVWCPEWCCVLSKQQNHRRRTTSKAFSVRCQSRPRQHMHTTRLCSHSFCSSVIGFLESWIKITTTFYFVKTQNASINLAQCLMRNSKISDVSDRYPFIHSLWKCDCYYKHMLILVPIASGSFHVSINKMNPWAESCKLFNLSSNYQ